MNPPSEAPRSPVEVASIRAVRPGHGANCSSIGSVVDTLFVTSLLGGALFAAVLGALAQEPIEVVGTPPREPNGDPPIPENEASAAPPPSGSTGAT